MADLRDEIAIALCPTSKPDDVACGADCPYLPNADKVIALLASLPLPVILAALGHPYREGWGLFYDQPETEWSASPHQHENDIPVLVVDNPATDEAHDA